KAVDFISAGPGTAPFNKKQDSPFFLYFPLTAPHTPIAPAAEFIGKSEAHRYGDYVYQVDWAVGQIINALERIEQIENTLIVFTSDNGSPANDGESMNGEPRSVLKYGHNPSHIYRGIKADIWEGGHRVPFIASWPERIPAGTVSAEPICHVDLMATCAEIVNYALPVDAAVDSYNLLHEFEGRSSDAPVREAIVHHSIDGTFAIRQGKWKLILGRGSGGWSGHGEESDPPMQLYDMHADVRESKNLYAEFPEIVAKLEELLRKYQMEGRSVSRGT
ncbi:MAG TPA: sulfatase-like hydrolase/transferase, partial [Candidatus Hydrogenedentes bacterium]|nr:sulfatase-like hydrolase/transferase [Candidatus Hydrogenedentota bacterium]